MSLFTKSRWTDNNIKFYHAPLVCTTIQEKERKRSKGYILKEKAKLLKARRLIFRSNNKDLY